MTVLGSIALTRDGSCGVITKVETDGWIFLDGKVENAFLPNELMVVDSEAETYEIVASARAFGIDPLQADKMPQLIQKAQKSKAYKALNTAEAPATPPTKQDSPIGEKPQESPKPITEVVQTVVPETVTTTPPPLPYSQGHWEVKTIRRGTVRNESLEDFDQRIADMLNEGWDVMYQTENLLRFRRWVETSPVVRETPHESNDNTPTQTQDTHDDTTPATTVVGTVIDDASEQVPVSLAERIAQGGKDALLVEMNQALLNAGRKAYESALSQAQPFRPLGALNSGEIPDTIVVGVRHA
jgi:hypothetical protein